MTGWDFEPGDWGSEGKHLLEDIQIAQNERVGVVGDVPFLPHHHHTSYMHYQEEEGVPGGSR